MEAVRKLSARYVHTHILLKGGHARSKEIHNAVDILYYDGRCDSFRSPMIRTRNNHGTGCALSSAIAANLANGYEIVPAVQRAKDYVWEAMQRAPQHIGSGAGPLKHNWPCFS